MGYELVVVGGGPAGLSAALTAAYFKLKTVVIESASAGGALMNQYPWKEVDNHLGFYNMKGAEVAKGMIDHVKAEGVEIRENETVTDINRGDSDILVSTSKGEHKCKALVMAIGLGVPRKLDVPGVTLNGVIYSLPDPDEYNGRKALVIGGGDSAVEIAMAFANAGAESTIIHRRDVFRASEENTREIVESDVNILWNTELKEIVGDTLVEGAVLVNNQTEETLTHEFDTVLFSLGTVPNTDFLEKIGVETDKNRIVIDGNARTNIEGIFAAGDIVGKWIRIPQAIGEGGYAGISAFKYIKNPYWA